MKPSVHNRRIYAAFAWSQGLCNQTPARPLRRRLSFGFCASARTFAPRFFQRLPHGHRLAVRLRFLRPVSSEDFHLQASFHAGHTSSSAREFHPHALTDPYVRLSPHTALIIQPTVECVLANEQIDRVPALLSFPVQARLSGDTLSTFWTSSSPTVSVCNSGVGKSDKAHSVDTCRSN